MTAKQVQYSDEEFMEGLRTGDNLVLTELYRLHYSLVRRLVLNNNGSEDAARDIYQEALIVLFENSRQPGFVLSCRIGTYLYSVARRLWLAQLRKGGKMFALREDVDEHAEVSGDIASHLERDAQLERMGDCLKMLGEPCRTIIEDYYVRRMTMEEITEKFGYTNAGNAKNQKYKCMQRLKRYFFEKQTSLE